MTELPPQIESETKPNIRCLAFNFRSCQIYNIAVVFMNENPRYLSSTSFNTKAPMVFVVVYLFIDVLTQTFFNLDSENPY